jgi:pilus assembly protein CpaC
MASKHMLKIADMQRNTLWTDKTMKNRKSLVANLLGAAALFGALFGAGAQFNAPDARASDMDQPITDAAPVDADSGQFVRIGLNKSAVVRLPAEARDVIVGSPDVVDAVVRRKNVVYLFARAVGQTNVFFFDVNGEQILNLDVEVATDTLALKKLLKRTLPGNRITVDTVNQKVVLGGFASSAEEAKTAMDLAGKFAAAPDDVVNTIKIAGENQVMLKVKVVEIRRDVLKQLGVDWRAAITAGQTVFRLSSVNPFASAVFSPLQSFGTADEQGDFQLNTIIRAMENDGLVRTLAEPNLTAVTGQAAEFLAGGEFPFELCETSNLNGVIQRNCRFDYKKFGVSLNFTPVVLDEGRISLKIMSEVSEITNLITSSSTIAVPALNVRRAQTSLELPSGGSMMIAGLIRETTRQNMIGTPGLSKLPILGSLFRSREFRADETELAVFVTPYLVNPVAERQLTSPDKNLNMAPEWQGTFMGKINKTYGADGRPVEGTYHGNVGFIVE